MIIKKLDNRMQFLNLTYPNTFTKYGGNGVKH